MTRKVGLFHGSTAVAQKSKLVAFGKDGGHDKVKVIATARVGAGS